MLNKKYIRNNLIAFAVLGVLFGAMWLPGVGLAAILIGLINFFAGILSLIVMKQKSNGLTLLLCSGVLLLIGFSICSTATLDFR